MICALRVAETVHTLYSPGARIVLRTQNSELFTPRKLAEAVLLTFFREEPSSNIGRDTDNRDWGFLWVSSVPIGKCQDNALNQKIRPRPLPSTPLLIQYYPNDLRCIIWVMNILLNHLQISNERFTSQCLWIKSNTEEISAIFLYYILSGSHIINNIWTSQRTGLIFLEGRI
jgi:hypothetical protein